MQHLKKVPVDVTYIVAFSGGKDSVAMTLDLLERGADPDKIHLHHHDVDGDGLNLWDWGGTTSYCIAFAKQFGLKLFFSYRKNGIDGEIMRKNSGLKNVYYQETPGGPFLELASKPGNNTRLRFPAVSASLSTRWCSSCVKIDVLRRVIPAMYKSGNFLALTGERAQESANRAKYKEFEVHPCSSNQRDVIACRPILHWTEEKVWDIIKRWRVQPHPCYELGYSRCSCQICIFGSSNVWAANAELNPEKIEYVAAKEVELGFTLYNKMTIWEKVAKGRSFLKPEKVKRWAKEAMEEFVSPIIVADWQLPQGAFGNEASGPV